MPLYRSHSGQLNAIFSLVTTFKLLVLNTYLIMKNCTILFIIAICAILVIHLASGDPNQSDNEENISGEFVKGDS